MSDAISAYFMAVAEAIFRPIAKAHRARKGGETGINGSRYEGGQFLPGSEHTEKGKQKSTRRPATGKQEVSPYVWELPPEPGARSLFRSILRRGANNHHAVVDFGSASGQYRVKHITLIPDDQVDQHLATQEVLWSR